MENIMPKIIIEVEELIADNDFIASEFFDEYKKDLEIVGIGVIYYVVKYSNISVSAVAHSDFELLGFICESALDMRPGDEPKHGEKKKIEELQEGRMSKVKEEMLLREIRDRHLDRLFGNALRNNTKLSEFVKPLTKYNFITFLQYAEKPAGSRLIKLLDSFHKRFGYDDEYENLVTKREVVIGTKTIKKF